MHCPLEECLNSNTPFSEGAIKPTQLGQYLLSAPVSGLSLLFQPVDMEDVTIYTASSVPGAASHPTLNCLQWTGDGQLLFSTKSSVYILTPDLGLTYRGPSGVGASTYRDGSPHENPCGWFKTVLELDKRSFYHWPSDSQDWDSLVTGSLDVSIKSVVVSPSFLSADAGCILAVVSTNLELSLWCSVKNEPVGQWTKLQDATPFLRSLAAIHRASPHEQTLWAQVLCSSWSTQPDFGASPAYVSDSSLLALGNKAGSILLLRSKGLASISNMSKQSMLANNGSLTWHGFHGTGR